MSQRKLDAIKLSLYSSSSRQRNTTYSPNINKHKQIGEYLLLSTIGRGTFSKVKLGLHIPTKQKVAIKILDKEKINDDSDIERIRREIHILSILRHPNIVQLYETITNDNNIYIVMEYVEGKDLFQYIYSVHHLTEFKASQLFRQLISCLEYIHKLGIVHRDIKPENILLNKNKNILKLVDFGLSNTYEKDELIRTACGSPCYAAPEMISGKDYEGFYSDLWSCGVVLYCMLVGKLPFDDEDIKKLYHNIKIANYYMPNFLSMNAQDILRKILVTNPKRRIKLEELKRHPFFLISEKTPMFKGIFVDNDEIQVDDEIVEKMREKYFNNDEDCNINYNIIIQNVKNNMHNKITTIYNLLYKLKYEKNLNNEYQKIIYKVKEENKENKDDNINNSINYSTNKKNNINKNNDENEYEKSPSFAKINPKVNNKIKFSEPDINEKEQTLNKCDNNNNNSNEKNEKKYNIHNIKKILFNNSKKDLENNKINGTENIFNNNENEKISIDNNNDKRFNILVINNFMSEKESSQNDNFKNISSLNNKISQNNNKKGLANIVKKNKTFKYNIENKLEKEKAKSLITENGNNSRTKEIYKNIILKRIIKNNKSNLNELNRLYSINYNKKKRVKSSTNNSKKIINFTVSINHTNNNINRIQTKDITYSNINKIQYNNKNNNMIGISRLHIRPFQKCKKFNFDLFNYNTNTNNNNAIINENNHRHNYVLSKVKTNSKGKKLNKSISFGNKQRNGTNKFKKYIKKLFDEEYSINNDNSKNRSINLSPLFRPNLEKNKNEKIFNISTNNKNNKNLLLNIDSELSKLNKTNIIEFYKTNEFRKYNSKNQKINKTNICNISNISIDNNKNLKNNICVIKNNSNKYKNDFEEKMIKYMKQRFKNCQRKNNTKDISNNMEKKSKSGAKSPNSIISKVQSEKNSNKSYFKYNNKILVNNNIKYKYSNNSTKNNSVNKNKKKKNNINLNYNKKFKNFLFAVDFSNVTKKNISRNKNNKNKNSSNNNYYINNDLLNTNINNNNNNIGGIYISQEKRNMILNKEFKTTYHSKGKIKSKYGYEKIKYSPLRIYKKNKSNSKKKNISLNLNIKELYLMNHSKEKNYTSNNSKNKKNFNSYKIKNLNIIC